MGLDQYRSSAARRAGLEPRLWKEEEPSAAVVEVVDEHRYGTGGALAAVFAVAFEVHSGIESGRREVAVAAYTGRSGSGEAAVTVVEALSNHIDHPSGGLRMPC